MKYKIALIQNKPSRQKKRSLSRVFKLLDQALDQGVALACLPEIFYQPFELLSIKQNAERQSDFLDQLREYAKTNSIYLCTGSMAVEEGGELYNRSHLIDPHGEVVLQYDKCHLYDVEFKELRTRESAVFKHGKSGGIAKTSLGNIGLLVCYDIRFPEVARSLAVQGADLILAPAAFNTVSGPAHWHLMFRTRAVENQVYMAAVSPARDNTSKYKAYGHSMLVDPWGDVVAEGKTAESVVVAEVDMNRLNEIRQQLPLLKHRRDDI